MILRFANSPASEPSKPRAAVELFLGSQKHAADRWGIVPQLSHSHLAGQLAQHLLPDTFGELPAEVIDATDRHDLGWQPSDDRQLAHLAVRVPRPFPAMPDDELASWKLSIAIAEAGSPLTRCLISRHFSALAQRPGPGHDAFLDEEIPRRTAIENRHGFKAEEMKQWAGALGFCDLVSLYLSSGLCEPAWFALTHPAYSDADKAPRITLILCNGEAQFSPRVFAPGAQIRIDALRLPENLTDPEPATFIVKLG
jgi:hypothetical protein